MAAGDDLETSSSLLRRVRDLRDDEAWRTFVRRYEPFVASCCRACRLDGDGTEEVTQRVMAHLVRKMKHFIYDPAGSFRGWLSQVVRRKVFDFGREHQRTPGSKGSGGDEVCRILEQVPCPAIGDELSEEANEDEQRLRELTKTVHSRVQARVSPRTWQAFWLRDIEGMPTRQVAQQLGLTVAGVHMARGRIRAKLEEEAKILLQEQGSPSSCLN